MTEFWETSFREKQEMWGWTPADSAVATVALFQQHELRNILIPGFGYGRNAKIFADKGFAVTGIEISQTAVEIANRHFGSAVNVYQGSVSEMPFDDNWYDGVFSYALIHLLDRATRAKLIGDCYTQLTPGGYMVFVAISKEDFRYGQGTEVGTDTFETWPGVTLFFYDADTIQADFGAYGLLDAHITNEPIKQEDGKPTQRFWYIVCQKPL